MNLEFIRQSLYIMNSKEQNSLSNIVNDFKELFCIPRTYETNSIGTLESFPNFDAYLKDVEEQEKIFSHFFVNEIRRLLIFRHLMCLKSNYERNFRIKNSRPLSLTEGSNNIEPQNECSRETNDNIIQLSRLDFPLSVNEKSFCYNADDEACRVPKTLIKIWFNNSQEFFYEEVKKMLIGNGYEDPMLSKLKDDMLNILKWRGHIYDGFVVGWINAIIEKCRMYL